MIYKHTKFSFLLMTLIFMAPGADKNRPSFGLYYSQANLDLFSVGLVQEKELNRLPVQYQLQLGYIYDHRENKKYGHGVTIDWIAAPFFSLRQVKLGPFLGLDLLLEAYKMKEYDIMYRERDFGFQLGGYGKAWDHVSLRVGVIKYYLISKFFILWSDYPLAFYFSISATL